jgi:hypothetical protein
MALNENMIPFLYPVVQAVFDKEYEGVFFGPNAFVYPIVDAALRGQYVNGVPVFGPDGHANIICQIGDATVEFIQHCVENYCEDEEQKSFLVRVCQDAANFIHECVKDAIDVQQQQQQEQNNVPDNKAQKRRRDDDEEDDWDIYDPENPQPPIDLVPAPRSSRKAARQEEEDEEDNLPEEGAEDVVMVFGPGNPASIPFQELNAHLNYDVANIAYNYFLDFEDLFFLSDEDIKRM